MCQYSTATALNLLTYVNQPSAPHSSIRNIFFKNEGQKPTWSSKGRGTVADIQQAITISPRYKRRGEEFAPTPFAFHATNPISGIAEALSAVAIATT